MSDETFAAMCDRHERENRRDFWLTIGAIVGVLGAGALYVWWLAPEALAFVLACVWIRCMDERSTAEHRRQMKDLGDE